MLFQSISKLFEDKMEKMWADFSKDKEMVEPTKITNTEILYPKHTFQISFPKDTKEYSTKIRSRNIKVALNRFLHSFDKIEYKGKTYFPEDYPDLQLRLELTGDFDFIKI